MVRVRLMCTIRLVRYALCGRIWVDGLTGAVAFDETTYPGLATHTHTGWEASLDDSGASLAASGLGLIIEGADDSSPYEAAAEGPPTILTPDDDAGSSGSSSADSGLDFGGDSGGLWVP